MKEKKKAICPICNEIGSTFYRDIYYRCHNCSGIFMAKQLLPDRQTERERYESHINDVNDPRYQNFVSPITEVILSNFSPHHKGLDFGAGTGPVISKILKDNGYQIYQYDPFFSDDISLLGQKYDYIVCCEVIEHFHNPKDEFKLLKELMNEGGKLICMTHLYNMNIDFDQWYYKNDPTHVFIYMAETVEWIKINLGFSAIVIDDRLIQFCI